VVQSGIEVGELGKLGKGVEGVEGVELLRNWAEQHLQIHKKPSPLPSPCAQGEGVGVAQGVTSAACQGGLEGRWEANFLNFLNFRGIGKSRKFTGDDG
jgi:hypothetical protein